MECSSFARDFRDSTVKLPDPERPFLVEVDTSEECLEAVLSQHHRNPEKLYPYAFFSCKLSLAECNYDIGHPDLLAVKRRWRSGNIG